MKGITLVLHTEFVESLTVNSFCFEWSADKTKPKLLDSELKVCHIPQQSVIKQNMAFLLHNYKSCLRTEHWMCAQSKTSYFSSFIAGQSPEMTNIVPPPPKKKKTTPKTHNKTTTITNTQTTTTKTQTPTQQPQQTSKSATTHRHICINSQWYLSSHGEAKPKVDKCKSK